MGNNEAYRNCFITSGARNELFYTFMGTRYIISDSDPGFAYEKVASGDTLTLYKNTSAFPIAYKSGATISEEEFDKSSFPYSAELLLNYTVVEGGDKPDFETAIIECDVEESYSFEKESSETYEIELSEEYLGKIMYLTFEIDNEGDNANRKDLTICINDVQNKLTAYTWQYYNGNTRFDFVVPLEESTTLTVYVSKGLFEIKDLHMYISDPLTVAEHTEADELELRSFSGKVSCQVSGKEGEYLVTSIPNDKGFSATVNGEKTEIVTVNKAFVGIPLSEGENSIVISYTPPFFVPGVAVSIVGLALALYEILKERFRKNEN